MRFWVLLVAGLTLVASGALARHLLRPTERDDLRTSLSVEEFMGREAPEGFQRALGPRRFNFPRDHGPHPDFQTEWWYLTGNLEGPEGEPFGFQFTVFRSALSPDHELRKPEGEGSGAGTGEKAGVPGESSASGPFETRGLSSWRTRQLYMGHFAVTDGAGRRHEAFERFARGAVGLAGAELDPFRVWVGDWELRGDDGSSTLFPLNLRGREEGVVLTLTLEPEKPMVLQGHDGLSQKGPEDGNASYYYSFTRLSATGELVLDGDSLPVAGSAWMDREWSTSALSQGQVGWDWFALQLEDGHDLMYYQLRRDDGTPDTLSAGVWVDPAGRKTTLPQSQVTLDVLGEWLSDLDGTSYPSGWRLDVPSLALSLDILPVIPNQEMDLTFRYWEGAVRVEGTRGGVPMAGVGYVELTGYVRAEEAEHPTGTFGRTGGG